MSRALAPTPLTVIGGYLGAGKTTLLNALLRQPDGRRLAVLVNDFGSINIDAALIRNAGEDVISLANGCICCGAGEDLLAALLEVLDHHPRPQHIVIEASGVAEPQRVRGILSLLPGVQVDAVVVLAEAETVQRLADDPQVGPLIRSQLASADLLVLTKCDLATSETLSRIRHWSHATLGNVEVLESRQADLPTSVVLGPLARTGPAHASPACQPAHVAASDQLFTHIAFETKHSLCGKRLSAILDAAPPGLIRAKGFVRLTSKPRGDHVLQLVGRRWTLERVSATARGSATSLVFIGHRDSFDARGLLHDLDQARSQGP